MSKAQIQSYLKFFASKRDVSVSEVEAVFQDTTDSRLTDDMFSKEEVESLLTGLKTAVKAAVRRELERAVNMTAVVIERVLLTSAAAGTELTLDMSKAEDEASLARVGTADALSEADAKRASSGGGVKLDSLRDEQARLVSDNSRLKEENAVLKERYTTMQTRATAAVKDVTELTQQVATLTAQLEEERSGPKGGTTVTQSDAAKVAALEQRVKSLEKSLADAESSLKSAQAAAAAAASAPAPAPAADVPVTQSKQFLQLKAMLDKKNGQLTEVRRRLAKYEPDDTAVGDDDAPSGK